ncbi:UAA transporter [Cyathus striatus]|nr:UAA transporter [Cyathus striatus]
MLFALLSDWFSTLSLIFGGCCSNAITLEQLTSHYPHAGSLITFFQFLIISLHGLPKQLIWTSRGPRLRQRKIPLTPYLIQVTLFYLISLLNNIAFGYKIPMAVHIIFRSGGLVVSMLLGWLINGKKYSATQVLSVLLVTLGVILTTLSASPKARPKSFSTQDVNPYTYLAGIGILTAALFLGGFLGIVQERTWARYGKPPPASAKQPKGKEVTKKKDDPPAWQESMFYLHFLALPMFYPLLPDLKSQFSNMIAGPRMEYPVHLPTPLTALQIPPPHRLPRPSFLSSQNFLTFNPQYDTLLISFPGAFLPMVLNTLTQLLCVAGVHRLTTRVTNLTVTLVLVVRKAVSLVISVLGLFGAGGGKGGGDVDWRIMWTGAGLVLLGTIGYSLGSTAKKEVKKSLKEE